MKTVKKSDNVTKNKLNIRILTHHLIVVTQVMLVIGESDASTQHHNVDWGNFFVP